MSLQFYMGEPGSGKSTQLYKDVTEWAQRSPEKNFIFLVPDQYTMQAQIEIVKNSPNGGIMNVEVLSFMRLAHRVFEETGYMNGKIVLDDTGKSLVLRALADSVSDRMPFLCANLNKVGFIHEIKSVISELKQYDISPDGLDKLIDACGGQGLLSMKLKDIKTVYCAFNDYTRSEYITTEETTALLTEAVNHSRLIKNAVVIMDGFTGFTPVQYRLLQALLELTSKVIITITIDIDSSPYSMRGEQELFYLSKKTIKDIQMLSQQVNIRQDKDVLFKTALRYSENPELDHLQKHIFRYPIKKYDRPVENIVITENNNIRDEINDVCLKIKELVLEKGYAYRDMAIVCADLDSYADIFDECAQIHDIPFFIDRNGKLKLNPFVEFILSALMIIKENYSYRSVMHFLRSGLCYAEREDIDEFDNYILKHGIKGRSRYAKLFAGVDGKTEEGADELEILNKVNEIRRSLMEGLEGLLEKPKCASDYTKALRKLISYYGIEEKLSEMKSVFDSSFEREKASEYAQVYSLIMGLLSQIDDLLSDMPISLEEFTAILRSGIEEIDIGRIPGGIDRVIVGDITRSRISNIKILFFTGVND